MKKTPSNCNRCNKYIDTDKDSHYSAVPRVGILCLNCHKTWMEEVAVKMTDEQRRRLEQARARREAEQEQLAETTRQSFASYIGELPRPVVRVAVDAQEQTTDERWEKRWAKMREGGHAENAPYAMLSIEKLLVEFGLPFKAILDFSNPVHLGWLRSQLELAAAARELRQDLNNAVRMSNAADVDHVRLFEENKRLTDHLTTIAERGYCPAYDCTCRSVAKSALGIR